jgi:hypothetical protein
MQNARNVISNQGVLLANLRAIVISNQCVCC